MNEEQKKTCNSKWKYKQKRNNSHIAEKSVIIKKRAKIKAHVSLQMQWWNCGGVVAFLVVLLNFRYDK